ncbi:plasmid mobilization relaxosome protein MobC [Chitinophaga oryzae]|uniref:Plasmid mobilization relaxosome protein MobC n=1 Tax=Chitinophaga oryzae TaxID=2725414 RepID=A0AAE6ZBI6_9BACT|nr:plasmid mobilization relaxosome protein MobC [Chitinophaga oryzae]QJB29901.1 plasmid mobilization relaxosome protein MobC [Chitinophaga oryzae]
MDTKERKWISIRVKPDEYQQIFQLYKSTTCRKLSQYVRAVLLKKPVTVKHRNQSADDLLTELIALKNELSAIGNNYNQAVKKLHTLREQPEYLAWILSNERQQQELLQKVSDINRQMNQIYLQWSQK